jgi:hypothetical protein
LQRHVPKFFPLFLALLLAVVLFSGCNVALGPAYTIQKQNLEIHFLSTPEPHLAVRCAYQLVNSGNQPLQNVRIVVPSSEGFHRAVTATEWNGKPLDMRIVGAASPTDVGDTIELQWTDAWKPKQKRTLILSYELSTGSHLGSFLAVAPEAFFAYPDSWNPKLLAPKGAFGTGGDAPKKWNISVRVPAGFLVHASGSPAKKSSSRGEIVYSFSQNAGDFAPFAAGGKYVEKEVHADGERILFWTLQPVDQQAAKNAAAAISRRAHYYETEYGKGGKEDHAIRLLECAIPTQNFGCGALPQTIFVHQAWIARGLKDDKFYDDANFELAYTWFGGVSRVRFEGYPLPMDSAAPYAGWEAQAKEEGGESRAARIRMLLADFDKDAAECKDRIILPRPAGSQSCSYSAAWTKSGLFFFALEDKIGRKEFHEALKNMVQYRRARDFSIEDLISSIEAESHQQQGPFVRQWLKDRGVPEEFRVRYSGNVTPAENSSPNSNTSSNPNTKETQP